MEYIIERPKTFGIEKKPCEETQLKTFIDKGGDLLVNEWVANIDNLNEFSEKYGEIKIEKSRYKFIPLKRIVICDYERTLENE